MGKSIAEVIKEEGILEGMERGALKSKRETLLRQLQVKFKHVPAAIKTEINATRDIQALNHWLDEVVVAKELSEVRFSSKRAGQGANHGKDHC